MFFIIKMSFLLRFHKITVGNKTPLLIYDNMEVAQYDTMPRIAEMHMNLLSLIKHKEEGKNSIELKIKKWATPFSILPLAIYSDLYGIELKYGRNSWNVKKYLNNINFPRGTSNVNQLSLTTWLPLSRPKISDGDEYLTYYENKILKNIKDQTIRSSFTNSLKYLTSEMVTNIKEHAQVDDYWILSQYWPASETCEIAIADTGIGYRKSYEGTSYEVESHQDAIKNAIQGNSSKGDEERGTGIPGMIRIFCEGYGGCVVIMSGNRLLYMDKEKNDFYTLGLNWPGAFVGIRFKLRDINTLAYLAGD